MNTWFPVSSRKIALEEETAHEWLLIASFQKLISLDQQASLVYKEGSTPPPFLGYQG